MNSKLVKINGFAFYGSSIKSIVIPLSVKLIEENAFGSCKSLKYVDFQSGSELQLIGNNAFSETLIEQIEIPAGVTNIGEKAFYNCRFLKKLFIPHNSKLQAFENDMLGFTEVKSLFIPSHVTKIHQYAFHSYNLMIVEFDENSELQEIDGDVFQHFYDAVIFIPVNLIHLIKS